MLLIDTAGLRRKQQVMNNADAVDIATSLATLREIKWCQVCVLLLDATEDQPLTHQVRCAPNFEFGGMGIGGFRSVKFES